MTGTLFRRVDVDGRVVDVRTDGRSVKEIGERLVRRDEMTVDGHGGALIPGLHDHHLHLLSLAAAVGSTDLSQVRTHDQLGAALRAAAGRSGDRGWIRAVGFHERPGDVRLDRWTLDAIVSDQPVRVQHRGGALWILNSAALRLVEAAIDPSPDVDRDSRGVPTGRLFRFDDRLRHYLPDADIDLSAVGACLRSFGITRVTDATPDLNPAAVRLLGDAVRRGDLPPHMTLLGAPHDLEDGQLGLGPLKIMLADHRPLDFAQLCASISQCHERGRPVAVHCVTREALVATVAALDTVGSLRGDRIEHASVAPAAIYPDLRRLGVAVVTQPDFIRSRGDDYLCELEPADLGDLYPYAGLIRSGIATCPSSDAPFGSLDPWRVIATARSRQTSSGQRVNAAESVPPATTLGGYLRSEPLGVPRVIRVGAPADLVLLDAPLTVVLQDPDSTRVRQVFPA